MKDFIEDLKTRKHEARLMGGMKKVEKHHEQGFLTAKENRKARRRRRDHACMSGNDPAYIFYGNEISWHDINRNSDKLGAYFQQKGVQKGDRIGLFMQNCPQDELMTWAREKMAAYKYPRIIEFRDSLPATSSGKVLRRLLKDKT